MAVAFDAFSSGVLDANFTHNPVGVPKAVIVWVCDVSGSDQVTGVTYGGAALAQVSGSPLNKTTGEAGSVHCFFLGSSVPTDDPATVDVTTTASTFAVYCVTLTADTNTELVDVDATISSDSQADPSVTMSLAGRSSFVGLCFFSGHDAVTSCTQLTDWTNRQRDTTGAIVVGCFTYNTIGTADVTAGWTQTAEDAVAIVVTVSEVQAGAGNFLLLLNPNMRGGLGGLRTGIQ